MLETDHTDVRSLPIVGLRNTLTLASRRTSRYYCYCYCDYCSGDYDYCSDYCYDYCDYDSGAGTGAAARYFP